jgi:hypothetical protein
LGVGVRVGVDVGRGRVVVVVGLGVRRGAVDVAVAVGSGRVEVEDEVLGSAGRVVELVEVLDPLEAAAVIVGETGSVGGSVDSEAGSSTGVVVVTGGVTTAVALVVDRTAAETEPPRMRAAIVAVPTRPGRRIVLRTAALPSDTRMPIPLSAPSV